MNVISLEDLKKFSPTAPAVHWFERRTGKFLAFTYSQLIVGARTISRVIQDVIRQRSVDRRVVIAVVGGHSPFLLPAILGIIDSGNVFCCLNTDIREETVQKLRVDFCLTLQKQFLDFHQGNSVTILDDYVVELLNHPGLAEQQTNIHPKILYCIATSGTTGEPKVVQVPTECIWPNIVQLRKIFELHQNDVIYVSAPPTFDPFIVDIFLALSVGASILITDHKLRLCRQELLTHLFPPSPAAHCPTFMQMTPSLFAQWSLTDVQTKIFSKKSTLRTLVLGGETFPTMSQVKQWQNWKSPTKKRVFNIYGITEISCWALIYEIVGNELEAPLGVPIDSVGFEVICTKGNGVGELFLKSSDRKCLLDADNVDAAELLRKDFERRHCTGDMVEMIDGQIFYRNRLEGAFVKKFGQRISLNKIERVFESNPSIRQACCVLHNQQIIVFYTTNGVACEESQIRNEVQGSLSSHEVPDKLMSVAEFPLSTHGKISRKKLLDLVQNFVFPKTSTSVVLILETFKELCGVEITRDVYKTTSFHGLGGSSMKALQIVTRIQDAGYQCPELMGLLLDNEKVIEDVLAYLETCLECGTPTESEPKSHSGCQFEIAFQHDLMKCVDAAPTIVHFSNADAPLIVVGSHSHRLVCLKTESGAVLSEFHLNDRIEGQATQFQSTCALVGCYAGVLYCLDLLAGSIRWQFNSDQMIKSRPLVTSGGSIVFGNYSEDKNLHCLDEAGQLVWSASIGKKGIRAAPLETPNYTCFVCTLDGTYAMICTKSGATVWEGIVASPIFANPAFLQPLDLILVAEVAGVVHCIDLKGTKIWTFKASGNIFSSFEIFDVDTSDANIIFGCHDKHLYSLNFHISPPSVALKWRLPFDSQIYATPRNFESYLIVCLTNGTVLLVDRSRGDELGRFRLEGEVFSTPAVWKRSIFIGCRDNNLYCLTVANKEK